MPCMYVCITLEVCMTFALIRSTYSNPETNVPTLFPGSFRKKTLGTRLTDVQLSHRLGPPNRLFVDMNVVLRSSMSTNSGTD